MLNDQKESGTQASLFVKNKNKMRVQTQPKKAQMEGTQRI
jgi:hypothetical protein